METGNKTKVFLEMLEQHKGILYKIARAYGKDRDTVDDLVQEFILQLWRCFDRYDLRYQHSTWIYRIALNTAISSLRIENRSRRISFAFHDAFFEIAEHNDADSQNDDLAILNQFIAELQPLDKALFLLYLEEKKQLEIAEIMGLSVTNVATKIARIKAKIKIHFLNIKQSSYGK